MSKYIVGGIIIGLLMLLFKNDTQRVVQTVQPKPSLITCTHHEKCGGVQLQVTEAECKNTTCCDIGGVFAIMTITECQQKRQEYALKLQEKIIEIKSRPRTIIQPSYTQPLQMDGTKCTTSYDYLGKLVTICRPTW